MIELPSLIELVSLESLCFYQAEYCEYVTEESLRHFSHINNILPTNIKEIRFGLKMDVMVVELRDGWKGIDDALSDPTFKNLELVGVHQFNWDKDLELEHYFQECMPKSYQRGILRLESDK